MVSAQFEEFEPERLVKSTDRVRDLGEVYTPANIVDDMLNLLPASMWEVHPSPTFLEPSVGNGNFVSAILSRKLSLVDDGLRAGSLPAGKTLQAAEFHALEALGSIYGVDISDDNIIGGTPGHEVACRPRLLKIMSRWHASLSEHDDDAETPFMQAAKWVVEHNMIVGNMLSRDADGKPTGRDELVIVEYLWEPADLTTRLLKTSLGAVIAEAEDSQSDVLSLFGPEPPLLFWSGSYSDLSDAEAFATVNLTGKKISNSRGRGK